MNGPPLFRAESQVTPPTHAVYQLDRKRTISQPTAEGKSHVALGGNTHWISWLIRMGVPRQNCSRGGSSFGTV